MSIETLKAPAPQASATGTEEESSSASLKAIYKPGLEGVPGGITAVSDVDPQRQSLVYRGYDIRDLSEQVSYVEVAFLLLEGHLPNAQELADFNQSLVSQRALPDFVLNSLKSFPQNSLPMDSLRTGVSLLGLSDPDVRDNSHAANLRKATRLVAQLPTLIAANHRVSQGLEPIAPDPKLNHSENFLAMLTGKPPDALTAKILDISLIVYAEHGFNASTFAARVTVSTLSDIYSGIVSAIGTLKGSLHGGANEEAMHMLLEIGEAVKAEAWIRDAIATKKKIMGFGHREYKIGDPRAPLLMAWGKKLGESLNNTKWYEIASIVEKVMVTEKAIHPNVDFPTAFIYYLMGLPIEIYTPIFALARVAGWSAHIIEQLDNNRLIRPKAIYEGNGHQVVLPLAQRA